jgi:hypothetical protein
MSKRRRSGRHRWVISDWVDLSSDEFWMTIIAVSGWWALLAVLWGG